MTDELQPLPLGTSSFPALRRAGQVYVDKTALIYELLPSVKNSSWYVRDGSASHF